jgi:hypothetical protein
MRGAASGWEVIPPILLERFPAMYANVYCGYSAPTGWLDIIVRLSDAVFAVCPRVTVAQVKEKFGKLRWYHDVPSSVPQERYDAISQLVAAYEAISGFTCEECGSAGSRRHRGYTRTLCDRCSGSQT